MAAAGVALPQSLSAAETNSTAVTKVGGIPRRKLGRTGEMLSIIGVGGHTMALAPTEAESIGIIRGAIEAGINFMDNAWDY